LFANAVAISTYDKNGKLDEKPQIVPTVYSSAVGVRPMTKKQPMVNDEKKTVEESKPRSVALRKRKSVEHVEHETGQWSLGF